MSLRALEDNISLSISIVSQKHNQIHHIIAYSMLFFFIALIIDNIHPVRRLHVQSDVHLIYCPEKYTLACLALVAS